MESLELTWSDPVAVELATAVQAGDIDALGALFAGRSELAEVRIVDDHGTRKTLLHVATDWPGNHAGAARTIAWLVERGVDVHATVFNPNGGSPETALHWAASADDVVAIDALLDNGADIEAPGAVFTGGTAMSDAVIFQQWAAATRLVDRGAATTLWQAAALDLFDRVDAELADASPDLRNAALWHACANDRLRTAMRIAEEGVDWHEPTGDGRTSYEVAMEDAGEQLRTWVGEVAPPP